MEPTSLPSATRSPLDRRSFLRLTGVGATSLGGAALLAACGSSSSSQAASPSTGSGTVSAATSTGAPAAGSLGDISVALSWIKNSEFAGEYYGIDKGYYTAAGLGKVSLLAGGGQTSPTDAVLAGQALVGLTADLNQTATAIAKGATVKVIGAHFQKSPNCFLSLKEKSPIATVAEMRGKKIGIQAGVEPTLAALLKINGMTLSDVDLVTVQYDIAPLVAGKVDAFASFSTNEPITAQAEGYTPVLLMYADAGLPLVADAFVVTEDSLNSKREAIKAFLIGEIKGWTDAVKNPTQSATYAVTNFGKDLDLKQSVNVKEAVAQAQLMVTKDVNSDGLFTMNDALVAHNIKALAALGTPVKAAAIFDLSILKEIYQEHPDLILNFGSLPTA